MVVGISGKKQSGKNTVASIIQWLTDTVEQEIWDNNFEAFLSVNRLGINTFSWNQKQFAEKLKQIVCLLIGCTMKQLEDNNFKEKELGEEWRVYFWSHYKVKRDSDPNGRLGKLYITKEEALEEQRKWSPNFEDGEISTYILTPRKLLQLLGTECGRQIIHPNIWINALMSEYKGICQRTKSIDKCNICYNGQEENQCRRYPNWIITDVRFPNEAKAIKDRGGIIIRVNRAMTSKSIDTHESETALDNYTDFNYIIDNKGNIEDLIEGVKIFLKQSRIIQ